MVRRSLVAWASAALLAGCTLAPKYQRPDAPVAPGYPGAGDSTKQPSVADLGWRDVFGDERLRQLVSLALENNRSLRIAALNVERARAQYRISRADLFPSLNATAGASFQRLPGFQSPTGQPLDIEAYSVGLGITAYELDFFGRVRSLKDQALEQYLALGEAQRSAHLSLVAEVAQAYLTQRALEEQLALARQTLETVEASFDITRRSHELGRASELDLRTAETQVLAGRFALELYLRQKAQADNALVLLVGQSLPEGLPEPMSLSQQPLLAELPAGLPSDLLERRPDILAAEHQLKAANANIGAARAAFFPSITLTATGGTTSTELSGLFGSGTGVWSFLPQLNLPLFAGGRLEANLDMAEVSKSIEVARYEQTIQVAFREVADALVARASFEAQLQTQTQRVETETRRYQLSEQRYRAGMDSYVTLLSAQRDLYGAQQTLIDARLARLTNLVSLYKALGGGWREDTRPAGEPTEG
ncbi:efflux transporter outer membrane subunit [Myxococcus sp. K15C18031901]|uniref:efflux transporter outer membrane subunit n=1 Tax=Myxococcus dinghuensis TaxID=2906761 RepID=UPI0020A6E922|nr:efflux transporter outer membrane subunit [Myxococcus dinghuensis]MCP3101508.1 efflux transporter outer membrane subunit [Myxococcus dinghuensis]